MEWGDKENRIAVVALHKVGKCPSVIFETLKLLGISRQFVYRTINRFNKHNTIQDCQRSGRPRAVRTPDVIKAVSNRIRRIPLRKQKIMAREMDISPRTMSRVLNVDLGLSAYRRNTGHLLTPALKEIRRLRSKILLKRYAHGAHRRILFSDEKIFTIEEKFNRQNDKSLCT